MRTVGIVVSVVSALAIGRAALADRQMIAPGTGQQDAVELDTGANGICETPARKDDIQAIPLGKGSPFEDEIHCGPDRVVQTAAAGDDTQLIAIGMPCRPNESIIDTGPDGIASSIAIPGDEQIIAPGLGAPNRGCVLTGGNGLADTPDPARGDDVRVILVGHAAPNAAVIRCGANRVAETTANNVRPGDDIQLVPVGAPCPSPGTVIVDSGADGISSTRAQGAGLAIIAGAPDPVRLVIRRRKSTASRRVKVMVANREFGATAPLSRAYVLSVGDGSCPGGTVSGIDADAHAPGIQQSAAVRLRGRVKGTFLITLRLEDVTSVDRKLPYRCSVTVTAEAIDTAPDPDDAVDTANNSMRIDVEAVDENDLVKLRGR